MCSDAEEKLRAVEAALETNRLRFQLSGLSADAFALHAAIRAALADHGSVEDGFGTEWPRCRPGCDLQVVRPGKVQCDPCDTTAPVNPNA